LPTVKTKAPHIPEKRKESECKRRNNKGRKGVAEERGPGLKERRRVQRGLVEKIPEKRIAKFMNCIKVKTQRRQKIGEINHMKRLTRGEPPH